MQFGSMLAPLDVEAPTTGELLSRHWAPTVGRASRPGHAAARTGPAAGTRHPGPAIHLPGRELPQPREESGLDAADFPFNTLFTKAPSCITAADTPVVRPRGVELLDYEIELGLVLRRDLPAGTTVSPDRLGDWLAGVTIVNDLSARDIQLPQGQFYKGKSFRGFGPVGPALVLLTPRSGCAGRNCECGSQ